MNDSSVFSWFELMLNKGACPPSFVSVFVLLASFKPQCLIIMIAQIHEHNCSVPWVGFVLNNIFRYDKQRKIEAVSHNRRSARYKYILVSKGRNTLNQAIS